MLCEVRSKRVGIPNPDYFRLRDFEYAQPLYDLAFLLEVEALSNGAEVPKYRTFSLWRAAYRMDGYTTSIDQWLDRKISDSALDNVPSGRIRQYLEQIRSTGTLTEIADVEPERAQRILRLRSVRGLGTARIAELMRKERSRASDAVSPATPETFVDTGPENGNGNGQANGFGELWQAAHVVPPLLRLLRQIEIEAGREHIWYVIGIKDGIQPVKTPFSVQILTEGDSLNRATIDAAILAQPFFALVPSAMDRPLLQHQLGWSFHLDLSPNANGKGKSISQLAKRLDPLTRRRLSGVRGDLHLHTNWSDGNTDTLGMARTLKKAGRQYFAITDHSRSCKVQGGLTPVTWLRQAASLRVQNLPCPVLHGIEVDIRGDGSLDLPGGLLCGMDLVIGSVHGTWSANIDENTLRLIRAVESGLIDIIGHPSSAVIGKPGVPNYRREPAPLDWARLFRHCARWHVALELNCFPSRLDLPLQKLRDATAAGCWISLGSDAHSRTHVQHLRFGERIISQLQNARILNKLTYDEIRRWISDARAIRRALPRTGGELFAIQPNTTPDNGTEITASLNPLQSLPSGSRVVGLDLTAGRGKATGVAFIEGNRTETTSLVTDKEILGYIAKKKPQLVSIDSPLGLPGGGSEINRAAGIVRVAERDLSSVGVPAYPALIDSMRELTIRGISLKRAIETTPDAPIVLESYPGAAQDILSIPRKQVGLDLLRNGLRELGLSGPGLKTRSHDEMDAITSAIVGRYYEVGQYEPMGVPAEAQLIVPKIRPLNFNPLPVICLAGNLGSGKSIVGRYLALFYGFRWIRTRDIIRALLLEELAAPPTQRIFHRQLTCETITEADLKDFGLLILQQYHQVPLREKLMQIISPCAEPVVVDSIKDIMDVEPSQLTDRFTELWFVETPANQLSQRLKDREAVTDKIADTNHPIDAKIKVLRESAKRIIFNAGTLEELRWQIDDQLFSLCTLSTL